MRARLALEEQNRAEARLTELERQLCSLRSAWSEYAEARRECAVAGDFQLCLSVKMGDRISLQARRTDL